jgi:hypothetical protein
VDTEITETVAQHILTVYDEMQAKAEEKDGLLVFRGALSKLIRGAGISQTYYSRIVRALVDGGYVELLDRGGRSSPSIVILLQRPELDELMALTIDGDRPILTLLSRIETVERSIGGMHIAGVLAVVEQNLSRIDARLDRLEGKRAKSKTQKTTTK